MKQARVRRSDPHRCMECGSGFEVTYFDDRTGERAHLPMTGLDVSCPACGRRRSIWLPAGAERTVEVEPSAAVEADEGAGD